MFQSLAGIVAISTFVLTVPHGIIAQTIETSSTPFNEISPSAETLFTRVEGEALGIFIPNEMTIRDMSAPFTYGNAVVSGDYNNDGLDDIVFSSSDVMVRLFENKGNGDFEQVDLQLGAFANYPTLQVALVDFDNDGWLDLFFSGFDKPSLIIWNIEGSYAFKQPVTINNQEYAYAALTAAFGDIDEDGFLDIILGNWSSEEFTTNSGKEVRNAILYNPGRSRGTNNELSATALPGLDGPTLSLLLYDLNRDGFLDIISGNDFQDRADEFLLSDGSGGFKPLSAETDLVDQVPTFTMSIIAEDFSNDTTEELFFAQISGGAFEIAEEVPAQSLEQHCDIIENDEIRRDCEANLEILSWYYGDGAEIAPVNAEKCLVGSLSFQEECKAAMLLNLAIQKRDSGVCALISDDYLRTKKLCEYGFGAIEPLTDAQIAMSIPQTLNSNVFLSQTEELRWRDTADAWGVDISAWTWDTKAEDFDLDGFKDMFVTNGAYYVLRFSPSNLYFRNTGESYFVEETAEAGMIDYLITSSITSIDFDNDGDKDLVGQALNGPVVAYINNAQNPNRIGIALEDSIGNRNGIDARITIHFGDDSIQTRELRLSGGFLSRDAPKAYFGLGNHNTIDRIEITWGDGTISSVEGPIAVGQLYRISRSQ